MKIIKTARGGGRRRAQETHKNQDCGYPYTPRSRTTTPSRSRYATRSSTLVSPKLLPPSPPQPITACNRSLRSALRVLKEGEITGCSPQPNVDDPVHESSLEDIKPSAPIGSPSVAGSDVCQLEKCRTGDVLRGCSRRPRQARSFNLTEFAGGLQENSDEDDDEVSSNPNHEDVGGHRVKKEIAGLVQAIFSKYGDLTKESEVRCPKFISSFLESICSIYQKLEKTRFIDLTSADIMGMIVELQDLQKQKLKVGWLLEKLQHIYKIKTNTLRYLEIKREAEKWVDSKKRIEKELEESRMHMTLIQKKISAAEKEMIANEAKAKEYAKMELDIRAKAHALANKSLVHGLL